jgi:hypothetical protein
MTFGELHPAIFQRAKTEEWSALADDFRTYGDFGATL